MSYHHGYQEMVPLTYNKGLSRPSDTPIWGHMRGCLMCLSLCSYMNTAVGQVLGTLNLKFKKNVFGFLLRWELGSWGRTEAWASSPSTLLLPKPYLCVWHPAMLGE